MNSLKIQYNDIHGSFVFQVLRTIFQQIESKIEKTRNILRSFKLKHTHIIKIIIIIIIIVVVVAIIIVVVVIIVAVVAAVVVVVVVVVVVIIVAVVVVVVVVVVIFNLQIVVSINHLNDGN